MVRALSAPRVPADSTAAVDAFMAGLDHPEKATIAAIRAILLGVDPEISEGILWKVPSFRTTVYFATMHLRLKVGVGVILHRGAKVRELPEGGLPIHDPAKRLTWLAPDRALVAFGGLGDVTASQPAFEAIVRQWIGLV